MDSNHIDRTGEPVQPDQIDHRASPEPAPDNPFRRLWDGGYARLVPIVPPDAVLSPHSSLFKRPGGRGKAVGELGPHGWRGFDWFKHITTEDDLDRWFAMGAGVGCRMGDGLVGIDIDALDQAQSLAAMNAAFDVLGPAPRRIGRAPKMLLLYRCSQDVPYQRVTFAGPDGKENRVEILGPNQQAVFHGIHPATGKPYRWADGLPERDLLPEIGPEQMQAFFDRLVEILPDATRPRPTGSNSARGSVDQDTLVGGLEPIRAAVAAIPNDRSDRSWYLRMSYAIKAALREHPEEAFDIFWEWAEAYTDAKGRPKTYESAWSHWGSLHPPYELGADWIYGEASSVTGVNMRPAEKHFDVVEAGDVDTSGFVEAPARLPPAATRTLDFVKLSEWAGDALTARSRPLIKGLLDQGAMSVLYGDSNVGKTFVALDMAYAISRGLPWGGMRTTRKVAAYVAAEGGQGARKRGAALLKKHGACDNFHILPVPVDLLREGADLQPLIRALRALGDDLGLVVIDTLSRALAGGDENSSTDMGAVVRHLDAIRNAVSAHVMVVHHTGKDKAKGARGHSLLRAATDTEIEVGEKQISVTKQRDLEKSYASAFELDVVTLGKDEDGDPVTSCTLRLVTRRAEVAPGLATPTEQLILDGLEACADTADDPRAGVLQRELVSFFNDPDFGSEKLRFHFRALASKNLIERVGRGRWRTRCPGGNSLTTWFEPQEVPVSPERSGGSPLVGGVFD